MFEQELARFGLQPHFREVDERHFRARVEHLEEFVGFESGFAARVKGASDELLEDGEVSHGVHGLPFVTGHRQLERFEVKLSVMKVVRLPLFVAEGSLLEEQLDDCDREGEDVIGAHLFARETGVVFCARLEHVGRGLLGREHVQILRAYGCGLHLRFSDGLCEFCGLVVADLVEDLVVVGDLLKDIGRFYIAMAYA